MTTNMHFYFFKDRKFSIHLVAQFCCDNFTLNQLMLLPRCYWINSVLFDNIKNYSLLLNCFYTQDGCIFLLTKFSFSLYRLDKLRTIA
jgi:hypothetical protein